MRLMIYICICIHFLGCTNRSLQERIHSLEIENTKLQNKVFEYQYRYETERNMNEFCMKYLGSKITNDNIYWGTDSSKMFTFSSLTNKGRLFLYFSSKMCSPCIDKFIDIVQKELPEIYNSDQIILIGDMPKRLKQKYYGKKILSGVRLPIDSIVAPIAFVVHSGKQEIEYLHIFIKSNPQRTTLYMRKIRKIEFNLE